MHNYIYLTYFSSGVVPHAEDADVSCAQFLRMSIGLFVIECKVKGTLRGGRGGGGGAGELSRGCCHAQGHTHADGHHIEISKWTA